ncbi:MAG: Crp/Fnr family transcriptional regulator [Bacteroidia bacterium]
MFDLLKAKITSYISLEQEELDLLSNYFEHRVLKRKEMLLAEGEVCKFLAFIDSGTIRHFHTKNGNEKTCDISFAGGWVTDFQSFNTSAPGIMNLQTMELTTVSVISKKNLGELYSHCPKYETFGRIMAEQVAQRATDIAMSLSSDKPEERFVNLLKTQPDIFLRVPQRYIANFLGISPESLSRIRARVMKKEKS